MTVERNLQIGRGINMILSELDELLHNNKIAIYGNGFVAKRFYSILKMLNLEKNIKFFVVTDEKKTHGTMYGLPIMSVKDIVDEKEIFICIAVHESIKNDIETILSELSFKNYIWVFPYMTALALGEPIEQYKKMHVSQLLQYNLCDSYVIAAMAVRYLAIDNFYEKNNIGYDVYTKVFSMHCEIETAKKRLRRFIGVIDDWDKNGYRKGNNISLAENGRLLDGIHRFTLACYHKMEYIYCDIYRDIYPYLHDYIITLDENGLSMDKLKHSELSPLEIDALEQEIVKLKKLIN